MHRRFRVDVSPPRLPPLAKGIFEGSKLGAVRGLAPPLVVQFSTIDRLGGFKLNPNIGCETGGGDVGEKHAHYSTVA
eukprot:4545972-Pyramimonas_sp.AAC.1